MIGDYLLGRTARAARRRANAAREARAWDAAAAAYRRYLAIHPDDAAITIQLGHMLSEAGRFDEAERAYADAATLRRDDADLLLCWGHSRQRAGDIDGAIRLYEQSAAIDGNAHAAQELERLAPPPAPAPEPEAEAEVIPAPEPEQVPELIVQEPMFAWQTPLVVVKPFACAPRQEMALFVTHSATGALKPHVAPYLAALRDAGIAVLLITVTDREINLRPHELDLVAGAIVRENRGYDFAAWAHAIRLYPELYGASTLYLLNDSVAMGDRDRFAAMIARVRASAADLIGLTESHEYRWHVQSYFLALKPKLLSAFILQAFFEDMRRFDDKDGVIQNYELRFTSMVERAGHEVAVLFPSALALNPTLFAWRELIADGFPFIKLLLLRGQFPQADMSGWQDVLGRAGFDLPLIEMTLRASEEQVPHDPRVRDFYAHPVPHDPLAGAPLKVAFYGPWNYDNGLGQASRGLIGALRRSGVRLNLHPIKKPFHIHRPLTPPVDVIEFHGQADVAIVHLNPDSWFLLTDEQRGAVFGARKRIGYWVWEMGHLPDSWRHDFSSVDRIWAPSDYCAELFKAQDEAPVDVIPHAVPVLPAPTIDRPRLLRELALPADRRIILYVFDGSSYLVRKNPHALVRAFGATGLAARGWSLVLKTKHLMDRPEDGRRFRELAEGVPGVVLIDRAMSTADLAALTAAADIYASSHSSEGFGLTIAEAMAAGKPVVATDYGGSRDFLTEATGYPVPATPERLDEDFGHYTRGGEWGRVDEAALAQALLRAATAIDDGTEAMGAAARRSIAETLSYQAVGDRIAESFEALFTERGNPGRIHRIRPRFQDAVALADADLGPQLRAVPLAPDGSVPAVGREAMDDVPADRSHWIVFAPEGSLVPRWFADRITFHAQARPDVAIFYADDVAAESEQAIDQVRLKPDFDLTLLLAQDYIGAPLIVRADVLAALGGLRPEARTAAAADLLLRAHGAGYSIARIAEVLLGHPGGRVRATQADYRRLLERQPLLEDCELIDDLAPTSIAARRRFATDDAPAVTLLVPTRRSLLPDGSGTYVERLLEGVAAADWPMARLSVIVGDDVAGEPDWARRDWPFALRRIETLRGADEPFNYAAKMNRLWREATTEQIVFVNDDVRPNDAGWLKALQTFAGREDVGGVGARLLFENGTLQHAGLAPHGHAAAHVWVYRRRRAGSYQDWALTQREWSMVTGAVFATRRSLMEQVNGFEERFSLEFNDADLCLRLRALGLRIVYTPLAEMLHTEKASRGERLPPGDDLALFLSRWKPWIENDPSWHPAIEPWRLDLTPKVPGDDAWFM